ncbi:MAG: hypothetical protein K6U74_14220 [Firmicutes bacterium]|nr:hypothetical protein [Bacillota bacterium]
MPKDLQDAKELLVHYFRTVWLKAGLKWDSDNTAEVESIVDSIVGEVEAIVDSIFAKMASKLLQD